VVKCSLSYILPRDARRAGADLTGADLNRANLKIASLNQAELVWVSLVEADLKQASLRDAILDIANLSYANLRGADLSGASLCGAKIKEADLWGAFYNDRTRFDEGFDPDSVQMQTEVLITVWELLGRFNMVSKHTSQYLGSSIASKYWEVTRPQVDWLNKFKVNRFAQIAFAGRLTETVETLQLQWSYNWMNAFIESCSQIVYNFPRLIEPQQLSLGTNVLA
jgi:hypothetical protein